MLKRLKNFIKAFQKPAKQQTYDKEAWLKAWIGGSHCQQIYDESCKPPWFDAWLAQPNPKPLKTAFKLGFTGLPPTQKDRETKGLFSREHWDKSVEAGTKARV